MMTTAHNSDRARRVAADTEPSEKFQNPNLIVNGVSPPGSVDQYGKNFRMAKIGRKPKGNRLKRPVSLEVDLWDEVADIAQRDGLPLTDVVQRLVAESLGLPVPAYCLPKVAQEELPLPQAS